MARNQPNAAAMAARYVEGARLKEIAREFGCSAQWAAMLIRGQGVTIFRPGNRPTKPPDNTPVHCSETAHRLELTDSSDRLCRKLWSYGASHGGLPNMTIEMCKERLESCER